MLILQFSALSEWILVRPYISERHAVESRPCLTWEDVEDETCLRGRWWRKQRPWWLWQWVSTDRESRLHWIWGFLSVSFFGISPFSLPWSEVKSLSRVRLFATPWTVAYQAPPSMGFSRQEYWSGLKKQHLKKYLLGFRCFKMSCQLLLYSNVTPLCMYIYPLFLWFFSSFRSPRSTA